MAEVEADIESAGAQLIWVLQQGPLLNPGTASECRERFDGYGSKSGLCVGDGETEPEPASFHESSLAEGRGFDLMVDLKTMEIVWTSTHGTPSGNENLDGAQVLEAVRAQTGR